MEASRINLDEVKDLPYECSLEDLTVALNNVQLCTRNIKELAQLLFSDPRLSASMIMRPVKQMRGTERVFTDIHTGTWWESLQLVRVSNVRYR